MPTPPPFTSADDFAPVKGRRGQYYCLLCTPPGYKQGQGMSLPAALRHERENAKHIEKVQEKIRNDWNYDPPCDWGPIRLPAGATAWEQSYPADRVGDFINFWLANVAAEERGEKPQTMDAFIDNYNKKYQDWLNSWYTGEAQNYAQDHGDKEKEEEGDGEEDGWNGVPGIWTGDNWLAQPKHQWPCAADPTSEEWVIREDPREEYLAWGFKPDELPDFQVSDMTRPSQPQDSSPQMNAHGRKNANGRRGKNRGQGRGEGGFPKEGGGTINGVTRRTDARRARGRRSTNRA